MERIADAVLDAPVAGQNLRGPTLRAQLDPGGSVLAFLRHFGCIFCREMVADLRREALRDATLAPIVLVHQGDVEQGRAFFARLWSDAPAIADPGRRLYDGFGLERGGAAEMFAPRVWACGVRALAKGHLVGRPVGDPWTMPGLFLVDDAGTIRWRHRFRHAGDHPAADDLPRRGGVR